jgi:hypothetical protein
MVDETLGSTVDARVEPCGQAEPPSATRYIAGWIKGASHVPDCHPPETMNRF